MHLLCPLNSLQILRQYVESDARFPADVLSILTTTNYPFTTASNRLIVLTWLCELYLQSSEYKKIVKNDGKIIVSWFSSGNSSSPTRTVANVDALEMCCCVTVVRPATTLAVRI